MIHTVVTLLVLHVLYSTVQSGKLLQYEQGSFDLLNMRKVGVTIGGAGDPRKELMGAMLARLSPAIIIAAGRRIGKYCNVEVIQCTIYLSTHRYDDLLAVSRRLMRSFHNASVVSTTRGIDIVVSQEFILVHCDLHRHASLCMNLVKASSIARIC